MPYARVMLYGYNSNAAFDAAKMGLEDHANTLLDLLNIERKARLGVAITLKGNIDVVMQHGQDKRPIIFVGHSLGGLVIKQVSTQCVEQIIQLHLADGTSGSRISAK